jgi:MerR family transcriptional regulator/heat shock protein HspR
MEDKKRPLFLISVVCEMFHVHPQTLRMYEREGFIHPQRVGRSRMYSREDLERIRTVLSLTKDLGVNRAGVDIILRMKHRLVALQQEMDEMLNFLEQDLQTRFRERIHEIIHEEHTDEE